MKASPTFFVLDSDTHQPVCFTTATAARSVTTASIELLGLAAEILNPQPEQTLVVADAEHFTAKLLDHLQSQTNFDLLVPMGSQKSDVFEGETFTPHWAGYATLTRMLLRILSAASQSLASNLKFAPVSFFFFALAISPASPSAKRFQPGTWPRTQESKSTGNVWDRQQSR